MTHAEMIAQVFTQACVDMRNAAMRDDDNARDRFSAVANALEEAYPREVRAVFDDLAKDLAATK